MHPASRCKGYLFEANVMRMLTAIGGCGMAPSVTHPAPESVLALDPLESIDRLLRDLRTRRSGLSDREAARRLVVFGPNELVRRRGRGWLGELVQQLVHPLALLLWLAAGLAAASGTAALAIAIVIVILIDALFAFLQERHAEQAVEALSAYLPVKVHVIRDSIPRLIEVRELVPGDVTMVEEGDRLSADARQPGAHPRQVAVCDVLEPDGYGRTWELARGGQETREPLVWVRDECCKVLFCADDLVDKTSTSGLASSSSGPGDRGGIRWRRSPERAGWSEVGSVITDYLSQPVQGSSHASRPLVAEPGECRSHQ
jgi:Cation transporter/ATPase, N-terminus